MSFVIYTIIKDNYDWLSDISKLSLDFDCYCYTNNLNLIKKGNFKGWKIRDLSIYKYQKHFIDSKKENLLITRWFKFFPHIHLKEYDFSLYIDGNLELNKNIKNFISSIKKKDFSLCIFKHPSRKTVKEEICYAIWQKKIKKEEIKKLKNLYFTYKKSKKFLDAELFENNIRVTNHNSEDANLILKKTFLLLKKYPYRDQIIFPFIIFYLNKSQNKILIADSSHKYFRVKPHKIKSFKNLRRFLLAHSNNRIRKFLFFLPNICLKLLEIIYDFFKCIQK